MASICMLVDYAINDESNDYCVHCARPDDSMQSFEEKKIGMTDFIIKKQGLAHEAAESAALSTMKNCPLRKLSRLRVREEHEPAVRTREPRFTEPNVSFADDDFYNSGRDARFCVSV